MTRGQVEGCEGAKEGIGDANIDESKATVRVVPYLRRDAHMRVRLMIYLTLALTLTRSIVSEEVFSRNSSSISSHYYILYIGKINVCGKRIIQRLRSRSLVEIKPSCHSCPENVQPIHVRKVRCLHDSATGKRTRASLEAARFD